MLFAFQVCPRCQELAGWSVHAHYRKYHKGVHLLIIRLACGGCGSTHAIMPSFSVPHTSLDTQSVQTYFSKRDEGCSRRLAAKSSGMAEYSLDFLRNLEKRLARAVVQAKALYPEWGNEHCHGHVWMTSAVTVGELPLFVLNKRRIDRTGCSFFGGNFAGEIRFFIAGTPFPLKKATTGQRNRVLDSS